MADHAAHTGDGDDLTNQLLPLPRLLVLLLPLLLNHPSQSSGLPTSKLVLMSGGNNKPVNGGLRTVMTGGEPTAGTSAVLLGTRARLKIGGPTTDLAGGKDPHTPVLDDLATGKVAAHGGLKPPLPLRLNQPSQQPHQPLSHPTIKPGTTGHPPTLQTQP